MRCPGKAVLTMTEGNRFPSTCWRPGTLFWSVQAKSGPPCPGRWSGNGDGLRFKALGMSGSRSVGLAVLKEVDHDWFSTERGNTQFGLMRAMCSLWCDVIFVVRGQLLADHAHSSVRVPISRDDDLLGGSGPWSRPYLCTLQPRQSAGGCLARIGATS